MRRRRHRSRRKYLYRAAVVLLAFLIGFVFGRVVLAAEHYREAENMTIDGLTAEASEEEKLEKQTPETEKKTPWQLRLVNAEHALTEEACPALTDAGDGHMVDSRIADALASMLQAGRRAGHQIWIASAYRTMQKQAVLYENKVAKLKKQGYSEERAEREAGKVVAFPGTSEHQLGLAVDLVSSECTKLDERQEKTAAYQWLLQHCGEYGFILRYPVDKTEKTGIIYEPWHFRYVGEAAGEIMERGICLEEYLEEKGMKDE